VSVRLEQGTEQIGVSSPLPSGRPVYPCARYKKQKTSEDRKSEAWDEEHERQREHQTARRQTQNTEENEQRRRH